MPPLKDPSWIVQLWQAGGVPAVVIVGSLGVILLALWVYMKVQTARAMKGPTPLAPKTPTSSAVPQAHPRRPMPLDPYPPPPKDPGPKTVFATASIAKLLDQVRELATVVEQFVALQRQTDVLQRTVDDQARACIEHRGIYARDLTEIKGQVTGVRREIDDLSEHVRTTLGQIQQNIVQLAMRNGGK